MIKESSLKPIFYVDIKQSTFWLNLPKNILNISRNWVYSLLIQAKSSKKILGGCLRTRNRYIEYNKPSLRFIYSRKHKPYIVFPALESWLNLNWKKHGISTSSEKYNVIN